jgi:putative phage-type endonuclease
MEQGSPEWFAARKGRVTGSNVGAILGLNPYRDADDVLRAMVREHHGAEREFTGNAATEYGSYHEDGATIEYQMETGNTVEKCGFFVHPSHDWLGASPDGLIDDDIILEVKCPFGQREKNPPEFKSALQQGHYWAQMQIEMECSQRQQAHFWQWCPAGGKLEVVRRDNKWLATNIPLLREFYDRYLSELDNPDHLAPLRNAVNTPLSRKLLDEYMELGETIDHATARRKEVLEQLVELSGSVDALVHGHKLTRVERQGSVAYAKVVKEKLPELDLEPWRGNGSVSWRLT